MPSSMSAPNDEVPPLTNEEIETLYDIVRDAQTLPDPPFRALFKAYDRVRAQKNKTDDGSRCFTFLVRMQEEPVQEGEELVDRFQRVLANMGIQVEVDPEGEGVEVTTNLDDAPGAGPASTQNSLGRGPSRRGSFDSFFDGSADKVAGNESGADLPLRPRRASGAASDGGELRTNGRGSRRTASDTLALRPRRTSFSSQGSLRIRRNGHSGTQQSIDYDGDDSEQTDSFDRSHIQIPGVNAPLPGMDNEGRDYAVLSTAYRPSETQIVRDAETFDHQRFLGLSRSCIQKWRDATEQHVQRREQMERTAIAFDRNVLLRGSLEFWRAALLSKRQETETNRFFERLETRAIKARNLFLLTKAFTHWAKSAEDEVQRTSTARRHILRTRYFNAWRDITAVNELKIQHFVLAKFLDKWRARAAAVREQNDMAVRLYEHNIVYRLYWQWFWRFAECRAPLLHNNRLAKETFTKWAEIVGILKEREAWATAQRDREILRRAFARLREKVASVRNLEDEADEFRQSALISSGFYVFRKRAQLAPLQTQVSTRVNSRVVRSTFQSWRRDAQLSRRAREVDRERILRNAFTAWNDLLRINAVKVQIDDRLKLQCLYKWALASRVSLFQRVHDRRTKESIFSNWLAKTRNREGSLESAEQRFANYKRAQLLRSCLRKIENATVQRKGQEYLAASVYEPRLKQRIFERLLEKQAHLQQLDTWADRANYYVTAKSALKRWQTATEYARRNRRREAYARMRRTVKINLVRRTFTTWKDKAAQIALDRNQADALYTNHIQHISANIVAHWRDKTSHLRGLETQALDHHTTTLTSSLLSTWAQKLHTLQTLKLKATALRQESTDLAAASCLKKLGWRLWTVRRQQENAQALARRNFERHVRAMLRFWWEQTAERVAMREPVSPSPSERRRRDDDDHDNGQGDDDEDDDNDNDNDNDLYADPPPRSTRQRGTRGNNTTFAADVDATLNNPGDETHQLESWSPFDDRALGTPDLDLSFSIDPLRRSTRASGSRSAPPRRPPNLLSQAQRQARAQRTAQPHSRHQQPRTQPPSILRPGPLPSQTRPQPAVTDASEMDLDISTLDQDADPGFWTSTPMPPHTHTQPVPQSQSQSRVFAPPRSLQRPLANTALHPHPHTNVDTSALPALASSKPGYLKTPSKRTLARAKRSDILALPALASPEKELDEGIRMRAGAMSAPPAGRAFGGDGRGITSFRDRLREGGFGGLGAGDGGGNGGAPAAGERERGRRVAFGDLG